MTEKGLEADVVVRDDPEESRYVIELDGERVGLADYRRRDDLFFFVHTEVSPGHGRKGLGNRLVRWALDDVRNREGKIVPLCPFVAAFVKRNPDYEDLVDHATFDRIKAAKPPLDGS